jgi:NADPH2:quinone reductase
VATPVRHAAEYCAVPSAHAIRLHDDATFAEGASFGIPAMTAYHAGAAPGATLLVQGGAGAVGRSAIRFAKHAPSAFAPSRAAAASGRSSKSIHYGRAGGTSANT